MAHLRAEPNTRAARLAAACVVCRRHFVALTWQTDCLCGALSLPAPVPPPLCRWRPRIGAARRAPPRPATPRAAALQLPAGNCAGTCQGRNCPTPGNSPHPNHTGYFKCPPQRGVTPHPHSTGFPGFPYSPALPSTQPHMLFPTEVVSHGPVPEFVKDLRGRGQLPGSGRSGQHHTSLPLPEMTGRPVRSSEPDSLAHRTPPVPQP